MQFVHIYVTKAIYALFVAKTIYPLYLESFCAWYSADRKGLIFLCLCSWPSLTGTWDCACLQSLWCQRWKSKGLSRRKRPQTKRIQVLSFRIFLLICWKLIFSDVLLTLTMGLGLTGGNKRNINFRMRPRPGDAMFRETCLNFVTDHQKHRKNCECCPGHSSCLESLYRAPATSRLD